MKKTLGIIIVLGLLALTALTVFMAGNFKTTAQQEAEAAAPPPSLITAQVTQEKFADTIPVTCSLSYQKAQDLKPSTELAANAQYTKIAVEKGETLTQGNLIAEINGSPVFSAIGPFAFYRDLHLADVGPDVKMLNRILAELGYQADRTGYAEESTITETTLDALGALYRSFGYPAPSHEDGFSASAIIVFPNQQTVITTPRSTGAVSEGAIAQITSENQKILCKGLTGTLSPEIQPGQTLLINTGSAEKRLEISSIETEKAENTEAKEQTSQQTSATNSVIIAPAPEDIDPNLKNLTAQVVLSESSGTLPVVPSSALWSKDGKTYVTTIIEGQTQDIPVTLMYSAQGLNEVQVLEGTLAPGTELKINQAG